MIINARVGQRSNRLIQIAHGLASALRAGGRIRITEMSDIKDDYCCDLESEIDFRPSRFWAFERRVHGVIQRLLNRKIHIPGVVTDWSYRDYAGVEEFHDQIVRFFTPRESVIRYAREFERQHFCDGRVRIGVHVRRGDYREWMGGRYYYDDEVYVRNMRSLAAELSSPVMFVLFSNEPIELSHFDIQNARVVHSHGCIVDDHYLMSQCNYLVGPPSTFSRWGAYMERRPMAFMESADHILRLADFKYISI